MNNHKIHMAPMQGYADHVYRKYHSRLYPGIECYYTPFIRVEKGEARRQDITRLQSAIDDGYTLVPQAIFKSVDELATVADAVRALGCTRLDLNLGCPHPMQTGKGRGAALVADVARMSAVADYVKSNGDLKFSVKMRLGMKSPDEWKETIHIINDMPLEHVTVHPRVATQMYRGELFSDSFAQLYDALVHPVIFNGDLRTPEEIAGCYAQYPDLRAVMIGRGLLGRPSLACEYHEGRTWESNERLSKLAEFHDYVFQEYRDTLCGETQILQKIKPFWENLEDEIGHKAYKSIHKATSMNKYLAAIENL